MPDDATARRPRSPAGFVTEGEAMARLACGRSKLYDLRAAGLIRAERLAGGVRYVTATLDAYLADRLAGRPPRPPG